MILQAVRSVGSLLQGNEVQVYHVLDISPRVLELDLLLDEVQVCIYLHILYRLAFCYFLSRLCSSTGLFRPVTPFFVR